MSDNSANVIVPNVTLRMQAHCSICPLNLHGLLRESFVLSVKRIKKFYSHTRLRFPDAYVPQVIWTLYYFVGLIPKLM
jgi:hypothetical protein